ncbi:MAG: hypothetical protein M9928_22940 [Anaerolineae bacterium]|nr:hypothetical protein [Anaerolineae bacterium]MCO5199595.1 hypothetical protein [Anaerolineae bacterium]MCO5207866.1 hypothetical protein [Anaerolineae bacterium]
MNDTNPMAAYDEKGIYNPVTVTLSIHDTVGVIALAVVAAFLSVGIVRLARVNADLSERLAQVEREP